LLAERKAPGRRRRPRRRCHLSKKRRARAWFQQAGALLGGEGI